MRFESNHLRVTAEYGTATLWLAFPGDPVNALDLGGLSELDSALAAVEGNPFVNTLVVRSGLPAGFCGGLRPEALASLSADADRGHFSWCGQQTLARLARLPFSTVAFIDGPCLGAGLELALACDYRLCVARPTTHLGFPDAPRGTPPCFGGGVRLRRLIGRRAGALLDSGRTLSGREARRIGLVDRAFCERRAKIELRTFLDERDRSDRGVRREPEGSAAGFVAERREFTRSLVIAPCSAAGIPTSLNPLPPFPAVVGLIGDDECATRLVAEAVLRGSSAVVAGEGDEVGWWIDVALGRGFVTPLEADQARGRVTVTADGSGFDRAGLVFADELTAELAAAVRPRCVVAVTSGGRATTFPHPGRVIGIHFENDRAELSRLPGTDADSVAALAAWLKPFGSTPALVPSLPTSARAAA
jgi:enoyl-CoA hydratase/carnithine racemase